MRRRQLGVVLGFKDIFLSSALSMGLNEATNSSGPIQRMIIIIDFVSLSLYCFESGRGQFV